MKRSDMIKEITEIFKTVTYPNIALKRAEDTLLLIEAMGMSPPKVFLEESYLQIEDQPYGMIRKWDLNWEPELN